MSNEVFSREETLLRLLIDSIRDYAVFMLDPTGRIATWNPGAQRIKQYEAHEIIGQHFSIFYPEEDLRAGKPAMELEVASRVGRFEDEGWRLRKDGSRFWANVVIGAVRDVDGRLVGFSKVTRDLTERRRAEEERLQLAREQQARVVAEAAEERFRFLAEASAILSSSLDVEETLQAVARIVVPRWADWCVIELVDGSDVRPVALVHMDEAKVELARELQRRWPTKLEDNEGTARVVRSGRPELYEHITAEVLDASARDPEQRRAIAALGLSSAVVVPMAARGSTLGTLSLVWAESGKHYRAADVPLLEEIGRRAGMAIENARLYRASQDAVRMRDEFLSIASHELRTPLTSLQLQVSGVQRSVHKPDAIERDKLMGRVDVINQQVDRLANLINGLLDVTRASSGRLELELEPVDLAEEVRGAAERLQADLAAARCPVELALEKGVVGTWDRLRLDQIATNLITNAMKYGAGKPIEIRAARRDGRAVLSVRDQGIGISDGDRARIFERFGRAVSAEHYGGLGLGLWIVKRIVAALGGEISVESEPGQGACFTVELPLAPPPQPRVDPERAG